MNDMQNVGNLSRTSVLSQFFELIIIDMFDMKSIT